MLFDGAAEGTKLVADVSGRLYLHSRSGSPWADPFSKNLYVREHLFHGEIGVGSKRLHAP